MSLRGPDGKDAGSKTSNLGDESNSGDSGRGSMEDDDLDVNLDVVDGLVDNANVRPKLDVNVDERMLMYKLRKELGVEDFNRIFNPKDRRIGEVM